MWDVAVAVSWLVVMHVRFPGRSLMLLLLLPPVCAWLGRSWRPHGVLTDASELHPMFV